VITEEVAYGRNKLDYLDNNPRKNIDSLLNLQSSYINRTLIENGDESKQSSNFFSCNHFVVSKSDSNAWAT
jgi:hypothetical protein